MMLLDAARPMTTVSDTTLSHGDARARRAGGPSPRPQLYLVFSCDRPLEAPARYSLADVDAVTIGRGDRSVRRTSDGALRRLIVRVPDPWMSATHAQLTKVLGRWVLEDANSRNGTVVNGQGEKRVVLGDGDLVELGHTFFLYRDAVEVAADDPSEVDAVELRPLATGLATLVPPLARELAQLPDLARSSVSIVIRGESGTGKELIARAVHQLSSRPGAFVAMNCGALPETLVETELFGYRKGAFSGAAEDRPGLVRSADRGTLFLDEIGDLPATSQAAFLRVLQEREVTPVGATRPVKVDLRLVAATHRDLSRLVDDGKFRGDLYARITGYTLVLPSLAERREDLGMLIGALLRRDHQDAASKISFTPEAARLLFRYHWPLNVRELEKCLGAAVVLARGNPIDVAQLPEDVRSPRKPSPSVGGEDASPDRPLSPDEQRHREELIELLRTHDGNVSAVARAVGKARMQVQRWIKRYRLEPERYRR